MTSKGRSNGFKVRHILQLSKAYESCRHARARANLTRPGCHDRDDCWNFVIELLPSTKADSVLGHPSNYDVEPSHEHPTPRVIGLIGAVRAPEVGYMLNADYWGKGYATEAMRAFMPLFFDHFSGGDYEKYEYAEAQTDPELEASQNVLLKVGFTLYEKREKDFENPILGWRDTLVYRMVRPS